MNALMPCWLGGTDCTPALEAEVADIRAYHAWLNTSALYSPFATAVILHNLVTSTVAHEYVRAGTEPRYACVLEAAAAVPRSMLDDMDFQPRLPAQAPKLPLPGLGRHRLVDCSSPR